MDERAGPRPTGCRVSRPTPTWTASPRPRGHDARRAVRQADDRPPPGRHAHGRVRRTTTPRATRSAHSPRRWCRASRATSSSCKPSSTEHRLRRIGCRGPPAPVHTVCPDPRSRSAARARWSPCRRADRRAPASTAGRSEDVGRRCRSPTLAAPPPRRRRTCRTRTTPSIDFGEGKTPQPYDDFLQASLADIQDYWRETYPVVYGAPFEELSGGIWASYPGPAEAIPEGCRRTRALEYIAQGNAFYCRIGDYIAYDDFALIPPITEMLDSVSAVGVVFAHEFGHAIQARNGALPPEPVVYREQQADCFAGAWTAHVARGESPILAFDDDDIKAGLLGDGVHQGQRARHRRVRGQRPRQRRSIGSARSRTASSAAPPPASRWRSRRRCCLNLQFNTEEEFQSAATCRTTRSASR